MRKMFLFCMLFLTAFPVYALRCGHALVLEGGHKTKVLSKCGDPINVDYRVEQRTILVPQRHWSHRPRYDQVYTSIEVEEWTYNFGPQRFMQLLRFENGILKEIRDLDRGF